MRAAHLVIAASFWNEHRNTAMAIITLIGTFVIAHLVDRAIRSSRARDMSPVAETRLRLVRRLVYATIVVFGLALALSQFAAIKRVATGVLASSAVLGLVVGFAARQTLANAVAGILLAVSQPIRIGDLVTFQGESGVVEDMRLTYTYLRADDGRRIIVPNEQLAQNTLQNHTIIDPRVRVEASVWIPPGADAMRALAALNRQEDVQASVAEVDKDGVRIVAGTWARDFSERASVAAGLRVSCLEILRREGLSSGE
ncbi:MAG: mechanosensitive ion channel family protein [Thermoleophilaceae bacterium]|jgi:small-conductance mechanosensitive channel